MIFAFVLTLCAKNWKWDDLPPLSEVKAEQPAENGETGEAGEAAVKPAEEPPKPAEEVEKPTEEAAKPAEGK